MRRRSNTWSDEIGEDLSLAAEQLTARAGAGVRAVVLRGAGAHFSAGGNPHAHKGGAPLAAPLDDGLNLDLAELLFDAVVPVPGPHLSLGGEHLSLGGTHSLVGLGGSMLELGGLEQGGLRLDMGDELLVDAELPVPDLVPEHLSLGGFGGSMMSVMGGSFTNAAFPKVPAILPPLGEDVGEAGELAAGKVSCVQANGRVCAPRLVRSGFLSSRPQTSAPGPSPSSVRPFRAGARRRPAEPD